MAVYSRYNSVLSPCIFSADPVPHVCSNSKTLPLLGCRRNAQHRVAARMKGT